MGLIFFYPGTPHPFFIRVSFYLYQKDRLCQILYTEGKKMSTLPSIHSLRKLFEINHFIGVRRAFWAPDRDVLQKSVWSQQLKKCHFLLLLVSCIVKDHTSVPSVKFTFIQLKKMLQTSQKSVPGCLYFRDLCCSNWDIPLQSLA